MLKSHERFHSVNGKRQLLLVEDEPVNRMMMEGYLNDRYELLYAENGQEALEIIRKNEATLSLILLDLIMPVLSGWDTLKILVSDPALKQIPVIVMTSDQKSEAEILKLGAADFIPKPYPSPDVVRARVERIIELNEDRQTIQHTERDPLTGLYNREYFFRYAGQFDIHHQDLKMDALVVDINHFHMINERFGTEYGNVVLKGLGGKLRELVQDTGGIVCRQEADTFFIYCPSGKDYRTLMENAAVDISSGDDEVNKRIRLRMGVYADVDKTLPIERRFDRAKLAANTVRNSLNKTIGYYDSGLHEQELYQEQLIEEFHQAIDEKQFVVFYQPKFDVRPEIPVLASAEALVRWKHPKLGMISPGVFIPLFEGNGLIEQLDTYVWREAAAQIRKWKEKFNFTVPVSVNISRIDMYDPNLLDTLLGILRENGLKPADLYLEITESAYTQESDQIIETVNRLREKGFKIEMDDFGTGYSSLNMISALPIDALKLDMQFIRAAFGKRRDTRMLQFIIDIADYLSVPVIAEGVETKEQLDSLKALGCDLVQGYYFSKPVPPEEYECFVRERRDLGALPDPASAYDSHKKDVRDAAVGKIAYALSSGFESVYYVDVVSNHYIEFSSEGKYEDLQIERSGADFFADTQKNIPRVVYEADRDRVALCFQKETLLAELSGNQPFTMTYRLVINGAPLYYSAKVVHAGSMDNHHIVIGISNVNEQVVSTGRKEENPLDFASLAKALTSDMESIYYVDMDTNTYMEFVSDGSYGTLQLEITGENFFEDCQKNIKNVIYSDDRAKVSAAMEKEQLLAVLYKRQTFSMDYRILIDGEPVFYRLKAIPAEGADYRHLIIGVSNVDGQITQEQRLEAERSSAATYSSIAKALAQDYFSIYYVNTETDHFIEYDSHDEYEELNIEKGGENFFELSRENIRRVVYSEDVEELLNAFTKENILSAMGDDGVFTLTYRLLFDGEPHYVHMKAIRMSSEADPHIVIGVSNIDAQMKREQEHASALRSAREAANRDSLTGVKSKHAYVENEAALNERIRSGEISRLAIVICDVNDLKRINDTKGHAAGDELIRSASREICQIFAHSPVFRYGGDEFVALLQGYDYDNRFELLGRLAGENERNEKTGGVIVACGMAELVPGQDRELASLFERADAAMYENKKQLKHI